MIEAREEATPFTIVEKKLPEEVAVLELIMEVALTTPLTLEVSVLEAETIELVIGVEDVLVKSVEQLNCPVVELYTILSLLPLQLERPAP